MDYMYRELESYSSKIYDLYELFFYDKKAGTIYCHDDELGRCELREMGFPYAYAEDFDFAPMPKEMVSLLNLMRSEASTETEEKFVDFVKSCYETLIEQRIYTAMEYKKLHDENVQLEKTLTAIKALL